MTLRPPYPSSKGAFDVIPSDFTPPAAVLFDWDNTLVDTWETIFTAWNKTLVAFDQAPWTEAFAIEHIQRSGREAFPRLFGQDARKAQKVFYKAIEEHHLEGLKPLPEAEALLKVLDQKQIPVGVVSNKQGKLLRKEVSHLRWEGYFGVLVGAGDAARDKPAAEPALLALQGLQMVSGPHVWLVGDTPVDWDCAQAAQCRPIAIGDRFDASSYAIASFEDCAALKKILAKM